MPAAITFNRQFKAPRPNVLWLSDSAYRRDLPHAIGPA